MIKILIDFDDTIFDTARFKSERIYSAFLEYGISPEKTKEYYDGYRVLSPTFSFKKFIYYVAHEHQIDIDESIVSDTMFAGIHNFTFPFASKLAEKYGEENMVLLTYGDKEFQEKKVKAAGISSLFKKVEYTDEDKENYIRKFCALNGTDKVVFIDDTFRHFVQGRVPKNLVQICVNTTGKLSKEQISELESIGVVVVSDRNKIPQIVEKFENKENAERRKMR